MVFHDTSGTCFNWLFAITLPICTKPGEDILLIGLHDIFSTGSSRPVHFHNYT
jgi:hypothetical protein